MIVMNEFNRTLVLLQGDLEQLDMRTHPERLRYKLYPIYINLLLNKNFFKNNIDIKPLCNDLSLAFKDYVYRSRTLLVARIIRSIELADQKDLLTYVKVAKKYIYAYTDKVENTDKNTNNDSNFIDKFGRKDG